MLKYIINIGLLLCSLCSLNPARAQENTNVLAAKLNHIGFENISICSQNNKLLVALENNVYRWDIHALCVAIDTIIAHTKNKSQLSLYFLENGIPQLQLNLQLNIWLHYKERKNTASEIAGALELSYQIDENWKYLKNKTALNSNVNKIDLVIYPQFSIQNRLLTQLYEIQFNIAPALEVSLWKGMLFTGQVIFPLKNDNEIQDIYENIDEIAEERGFLYISNEGDYIRPGFVTISQDFRLPHQWFANLTIGKFNAHRYGIDLLAKHIFKENRWSITANAGLTGSSHFYDGLWVTGSLNTFTWNLKTGYFYPRYNLQLELSYGSYLNNDKGFRAECTRHFGATAIGFYAMHTGGESNGGFKFTVPFPVAKRNRNHNLRLTIPKYFDSDYNAAYAVYYGKDFETRPNENQTEHFNNPIFIKKNIVNNFLSNILNK